LAITGVWFATKAPGAWREYVDAKILVKIKRQAMRVVKSTMDNTDYLDSKDKPACMDPATGASNVIVVVPTKEPNGVLNNTIVLDNGVGMAVGDVPTD
jgi:hypothetical protein